MAACQKQKAQRDTRKCGEHKPARAAQMNLIPVLYDDDARDGDRHEHGEWSGYMQRNADSEQWNGDQRLAKTECRANQCGNEDDGQNIDSDEGDRVLAD